ncbi:MAG: DUF2117 domain-containing protein [Candidatus Hadarchaeales archaeon]
MRMRIAVFFHMPGIFDSGWARRILDLLRTRHEVRAATYGTMGRTALLDSGMEGEVEFLAGEPSEILARTSREVDALVLPMYASSPVKSHAHCWHLLRASGVSKPLVEVEARSGCVVPWTESARELASWMAEGLGMRLKEPPSFGETFWSSGGRNHRRLLGVEVGDHVLVNRIVVGRAVSEEVVLVEEGGKLVEIRGVELKPGAWKKLEGMGRMDLRKVRLESTSSLRPSPPEPRKVGVSGGKGVAFIDHAGYHVYELARGAEGAVVVGDDTSSVVGDILFRLGKPVVGIVDGDRDGLLERAHLSRGSVILTVEEDDRAGEEVRLEIFGGREKTGKGFEEVKKEILSLLKDRTLRLLEV